jgi:hypothetical protein
MSVAAELERSAVNLWLLGLSDEAQSPELGGWTLRNSMQAHADWLTFDVMSNLLFGKSLGLLDSPDARWLPSVIRKISQLTATVSVRW